MFCNVGFAEEKKKLPKINVDYHYYSLNENLVNYGWKIKSVRKTSKFDLYILTKDKWILYCKVDLEGIDTGDTDCFLP